MVGRISQQGLEVVLIFWRPVFVRPSSCLPARRVKFAQLEVADLLPTGNPYLTDDDGVSR
jgi:hypothetical protein